MPPSRSWKGERPGTSQHKEWDFPGSAHFPDMAFKTYSLHQLLAAKDTEDHFYFALFYLEKEAE